MNTQTIFLSSDNTYSISTESQYVLYDHSTVTINISGITEEFIPTYLKIDWGDGSTDTYNNSLYKNYREVSILNEVLYGKYSSIFAETINHIYYPSSSARYKSLSAQVLIEYSDGNYSWFVIPIKIITGDYFETIFDLKHVGVNLLPLSANTKLHTFSTDAGGFLIESYS